MMIRNSHDRIAGLPPSRSAFIRRPILALLLFGAGVVLADSVMVEVDTSYYGSPVLPGEYSTQPGGNFNGKPYYHKSEGLYIWYMGDSVGRWAATSNLGDGDDVYWGYGFLGGDSEAPVGARWDLYEWLDECKYMGHYFNVYPRDSALVDTNQPGVPESLAGDPVNTINGGMVREETDLHLPCPGLDLSFTRTYNSALESTHAPVGPRWTHSQNWQLLKGSDGQFRVATGEGRVFPLLLYATNDYWVGYKQNAWRLDSGTNGEHQLRIEGARTYTFDSNGVLQKVAEPAGNCLTYTYTNAYPTQTLARVEHNNGLWLGFAWESNRLVRVDTPETNFFMTYAYNAQGELTNATLHTAEASHTRSYRYDDAAGYWNHSLTQRVNAAGDVFAYSYATNAAGQIQSRCTGVVIADGYYQQSNLYATTDACTEVRYDRGDTNQLYSYHYDTNTWTISRIAGPGTTNLAHRFEREAWRLLVTNEVIEDTALDERLVLQRQFDAERHLTNFAAAYCALPSNGWSFAWDTNFDTVASVVDPEGHRAAFEYTNGLLSKAGVYDATNASFDTLYGYTTNGLLCAVTNANGHWTRFTHDAYGRLRTLEPQAGPTLTFSNDALGNLLSVSLPGPAGDRVTAFEPNELGWLRQITYADGLHETNAFDALGNLTNRVDRAGRTTRLTWLPTRKLSAVAWELGGGEWATNRYDYDQQFHTLKISDAIDRPVESYGLDLQDRPVTVTNLEGQALTVTYGVGGYVKSLQRFDGTSVSNQYDSDGRLSQMRLADGTNTFTYYRNNLLRVAANESSSVSNAYSLANRLTNVTSVAGGLTNTVSYRYDPAGNVTGVTSVAGSLTNVFDAAERLSEIRSPWTVFANAYNTNNGLLSQRTCTNTGLTATYEYDVLDRLTNLVWRDAASNAVRSFAYAYNAAGMITNVTLESGERRDYAYDSADRLTGERWVSGGTVLCEAAYAYDKVGNRTQKTVDGVTVSYDVPGGTNGNRLTGWSAGSTNNFEGFVRVSVRGSSTEAIGTNAYLGRLWVSNLTAVTPEVSGTNFRADSVACRTGSQQIVVAAGDAAGNAGYATSTVSVTVFTNGTYGYSAAGCVTSIVYTAAAATNAAALCWDGQYRLTSVSTNGAAAESYGYDALGRRIATVSGGVTNRHVYDGPHVIADLDATGGLVRSYVYGAGVDNLLALTVHTGATPVTYYGLTDHQGTVHAWADAGGAVVESYRFDAWGRVLGVYDGSGSPIASRQSQLGNRYLWQGREYSWRTGLYYFRARWYDPVTGRFLSNDPIGISGGLNQYVFAGNNPVNFGDPFGLCQENQTTGPLLALGIVSGREQIERLLLRRQDLWNFMRQLTPGAPGYELLREEWWKLQARLWAAQGATYTASGQLTGYGALGLTGYGSGLSLAAIAGLSGVSFAGGVGIGYGASRVPVYGGGNVGEWYGEQLYNAMPGFWNRLAQ